MPLSGPSVVTQSPSLAVLFDTTLGSDTASIDTGAGGIAGGYGVLHVLMLLRTSDAAASHDVDLTVNNDTSAIYDRQIVFGNNVSLNAVGGVALSAWPVQAHGANGSAGYPGAVSMTIPGYADTTFWKAATALQANPDATLGNQVMVMLSYGYRSASAITRMKVAAQGAAVLKAGSRLRIVGA